MRRKKKDSSIKVSARIPSSAWLIVEQLAETTRMSDAWCLQLLIRIADRALVGDVKAVKASADQIGICRNNANALAKLAGAERIHGHSTRAAMLVAQGGRPPKPVPAELAT